MARLEMQRDARTKEYELGDEMIMGRKSSCQIRVPSPKCSREHCRIVRGTDCFFIEDMGSSNGTLVNGKKVGSHLLKHNDEIMVGGVTFRFMDRSDDALVGRRLGKYQIIEKVGVGGMGVVYRASQISLGREVALKVMNKRLAQQENFIQSFEREAKIAARLHHPNIIGIHDFGSTEGWYYFSMEFVDGENLLDLALRQGGLSPDECITYGSQIALALEHAHTQGILHKDIKPQNVMIDRDDNVKLADMGLAQTMGGEDEVKMESESQDDQGKKKSFMATPQYVAPEIIRRQEPDARSDLYSLSATLFHMLTGKPPYQDKTVKELLRKHLNAPIPDPRELRKEISEGLATFIMRGLAKEPEDRLQSAREYAEELLKFSSTGGLKKPHVQEITSTIRLKGLSSSESTARHKSRPLLYPDRGGKLSPTAQSILIAVGVVIIGTIGFLIFGGGSDNSPEALLKNARAHFIKGEDELAKGILEKLIRETPDSPAGAEAQKMLGEYDKKYLRDKLSTLKSEYAAHAMTALQAMRRVDEILKDPAADDEVKKLAEPFLLTLKQDRAETTANIQKTLPQKTWDGEIRELILNDKLAQAYSKSEKVWKTTKSQADKSTAWAMMENIKKSVAKKGAALLQNAQSLQQDKKTAAALKVYTQILLIKPKVTEAQTAANEIAQINAQTLTNLSNAWYSLIPAAAEFNENAIREITFQATKQLEGIDAGKQLEIFTSYPTAVTQFREVFMVNAPEKTKEPNPKINITIKDKIHKARLENENGKLIAVGKKNRKAIAITDVVAEDIEVIVPRMEATVPQAIGGALLMAGIKKPALAVHYIESIFTSIEGHKKEANTMRLYTNGIFPLATMDFFPTTGNKLRGAELKGNRLVFSIQGLWYNPSLALQLNGLYLQVAQNGNLRTQLLSVEGMFADFNVINGELRITVIHQNKKKSSVMRCSHGSYTVMSGQDSIIVSSDGHSREIILPDSGDKVVWPLIHSKNVTSIDGFVWGKMIPPTTVTPSVEAEK